jgi:hypothetical protein
MVASWRSRRSAAGITVTNAARPDHAGQTRISSQDFTTAPPSILPALKGR